MAKYIVKGRIISPLDCETIVEKQYMVVEDSRIIGVFDSIPEECMDLELCDYGDALIIPGFVDVHLHAPQYANIGLGIDMELLPWLDTYTFPEEHNFKDNAYAKNVYGYLIRDLIRKGTTSSVIFASIYKNSTELLVQMLREKGLRALVGKVNMDRNCPDFYCETTKESLEDTKAFIESTIRSGKHHEKELSDGTVICLADEDELVRPIITPRFVPTCTAELMTGLGELAARYDLHIQSHLSENRDEIAWVKALHPECESYLDVYDRYGLLRKDKTVMAHCVWSDEAEQEGLKKNGVLVAHCPFSNGNIYSGIAPIRNMMNRGLRIGLASDISGGNELFMGRIIGQGALASKVRYTYKEEEYLSTTNLFYMATKGGGSFLGAVGALEEGYVADYLVIDDSELTEGDPHKRTPEERLQRFFYNGSEKDIAHIFVAGKEIFA